MNFVCDYIQGARIAKQLREARASGKDMQITKAVPVIRSGSWYATIESTFFQIGKEKDAVKAVFCRLDEETQHFLTFTPNCKGGWAERAALWKNALSDTLPPDLLHGVMLTLLSEYKSRVQSFREQVRS